MEYTNVQLEEMLHSKAWPDRWAVARAGYGLDVLVHDEEAYVRLAVAEKGYGLDVLREDPDPMVRDYVAEQLAKREAMTVAALIENANERSSEPVGVGHSKEEMVL